MARLIDHLILGIDPADREKTCDRLADAGFVKTSSSNHAEGTGNDAMASAGGGFIEVLHTKDPAGEPEVWFGETPRLQGVGFTTTDPAEYDDLAAPWAGIEGSWNRVFSGTRDDGTTVSCSGASPVPHLSKFYPFIMDRSQSDISGVTPSARLQSITFAGARCGVWHDQMRDWFRVAPQGDGELASDDGVRLPDRRRPARGRAGLRGVRGRERRRRVVPLRRGDHVHAEAVAVR